jgi:hypothetical protein
MMGRKHREQANFFYEFRLDDMIPKGHLLRRINVFMTSVLGDLHESRADSHDDHSFVSPDQMIRGPVTRRWGSRARYPGLPACKMCSREDDRRN